MDDLLVVCMLGLVVLIWVGSISAAYDRGFKCGKRRADTDQESPTHSGHSVSAFDSFN